MVPNATIYSLTESASLIERVLGHVLRLPENDPVKGFVMYVPTHGRKKPGRQRTLFTNYIHCPLGDSDNLLNNNQLLEMAQDRYQWRKPASFPVVLGDFGCDVTCQACRENSRYRARFQASAGHSDSANRPGYEAGRKLVVGCSAAKG